MKSEYQQKHASRGQAVVETAIAIPLFLIGLFGIIFAYRTGMLSEQVQQSVRYGGLVTALSNPYDQFSLYTVYATIDQQPPAHVRDCVGGATSVVSQGHAGFWQPGSTPTQTTPSCGLALIFPSSGVTYPVLLFSDYVSASSATQSAGTFASFIFGSNTVSASQNFFRSPDLGVLLNCGHLGFAVKRSLEGDGDPYTPLTVPSPFPQTVTPTNADVYPAGVGPNCYNTQANGYGGPTLPY